MVRSASAFALITLVALLGAPHGALADSSGAGEARVIAERDEFVSLVEGRALKRFGIRLDVSPGGEITGSAFGREVTGAWRWEGGFFCRDLRVGGEDLGPNCQRVELRGGKLRFIADRGAGDHADLRLD